MMEKERAEAIDALGRIHNYCEEIDHHIPKEERTGYKMYPDVKKIFDFLYMNVSDLTQRDIPKEELKKIHGGRGMKAVLISIKPRWCELIASGKKTVEVRKTEPKLDMPFKCYIYCTKNGKSLIKEDISTTIGFIAKNGGKVIGEFVCKQVKKVSWFITPNHPCWKDAYNEETCLTNRETYEYTNGDWFYEWHISDLVIYDKPRKLSEFYAEGDCDCMNCKNCAWFDRGNGYNVDDDCNLAYKGVELHKSLKPITRPPQSWCYVESEDTE